MKRTLIIYLSRTGFTERYARWLADELCGECIPLLKYCDSMARECDFILFGGGVYGNEIHGIKRFKRIEKQNPQKEFAYFATGIRPMSEQVRQTLMRYNFSSSHLPEFYYFQGGLDLEKLEPSQRTLLSCFIAMVKRRSSISAEDRDALNLLSTSGDYSDRDKISVLVSRFAAGESLTDEGGLQTVRILAT